MWMKVDDRLHTHRKTRAVTRSHESKRRDVAPMGLWVAAGSWAAQNGTDGWVPEEELDRWDDDWPALAGRLVRAGYWWPQERDREPGFGFTDWHDYNDPADLASKAGTYGNHVRWHVNEAKVDPECEHCPKEPDRGDDPPDIAPDSGGDRGAIIGGESGGDSVIPSGAIALPEPEPEPDPDPKPGQALSDTSDQTPDRFQEFWDAYDYKVKRVEAMKAWAKAASKADPGRIISAASSYVAAIRADKAARGDRAPDQAHASSWLNGERWNDERPVVPQRMSGVQQGLALVQQLAAEEAGEPTLPQLGGAS